MKKLMLSSLTLMVLLVSLAVSPACFAQATRTWVSGVGDDANPCSRTAPCKTFAGAISKTAANGTINAIDSGGFGAVTITKAITIDGTGTMAGILSSGTNGVIVNAGTSDNVIIRNVSIEGAGTGLDGVRVLQAGSVVLDKVVITRVTQKGIEVLSNSATNLVVTDSQIVSAAGGGVVLTPGAAGSVSAGIDGLNVSRSSVGIQVSSRAKATVRNSVATNNDSVGFFVVGGTGAATLVLDNSTASNNVVGLNVVGGDAVGVVSRSTFNDNGTGVKVLGGQIQTFGDNRNILNTIPGAPNQPVTALQ